MIHNHPPILRKSNAAVSPSPSTRPRTRGLQSTCEEEQCRSAGPLRGGRQGSIRVAHRTQPTVFAHRTHPLHIPLLAKTSSTLIQNCTAGHGGGIYAFGGATLSLGDFSIVRGCRATVLEGGGLEFEAVGIITIGNFVLIEDCTATTRAGGMYLQQSGTINVGNYFTMRRNQAGTQGGGFIVMDDGNINIGDHALFESNYAAAEGGVSESG